MSKMSTEDTKFANRVMRVAHTGKGMDALEDEAGEPMSALLDGCWNQAEEEGDTAMARRLKSAFERFTA